MFTSQISTIYIIVYKLKRMNWFSILLCIFRFYDYRPPMSQKRSLLTVRHCTVQNLMQGTRLILVSKQLLHWSRKIKQNIYAKYTRKTTTTLLFHIYTCESMLLNTEKCNGNLHSSVFSIDRPENQPLESLLVFEMVEHR